MYREAKHPASKLAVLCLVAGEHHQIQDRHSRIWPQSCLEVIENVYNVFSFWEREGRRGRPFFKRIHINIFDFRCL
ncbi:hypothetical protein FKM82_018612 [Ascaphus truei]